MQSKFGLKDFVLLLVLLLVGLSVWLNMIQEDRRFDRLGDMTSSLERLERQLSQFGTRLERRLDDMQQQLDEGVVAVQAGGGGDTAAPPWAREGVEVEWQPPFQVVNDPHDHEEFSPGGTFTEIFGAQPPTLTPLVYRDVYGGRVLDQVLESLGRYNPETLELEGVLARAWQMDPDGLWFRVKIRRNARFSDGEPVTAEDVKFSYELIMNPEIEAERQRAVYGVIENVEIIDERVVEFQFAQPKFINKERALGVWILPKHFYEDFSPTEINQSTGLVMGTGPFRLRHLDPDNQWRPGRDDVVLVRNEQYWGPTAALDRLRYTVIVEDVAALTEYNNRNADMMTPSSRQFTQFRDNPEWLERNRAKEWFNLRGGYSFIAWNAGERDGRQTPFHDPRVRRAMTHLIDREWIIRNILDDIGEVATGPFNPRTDQASPDVEPHAYSLDKARELLADAGWVQDGQGVLRNERGDQFEFQFMHVTGSEAHRQIADYLHDQCARVGIRVRRDPVDWSIYAERTRNRDFDSLMMAWSPSTPEGDPYQIWHSDQIAGGGDNFVQWRNERADELINMGRQEMDREQRMALWHELHQIIHEEQPYTFLVARPWLRFINRRNHNVHPYMTGLEEREFFMPSGYQSSPM